MYIIPDPYEIDCTKNISCHQLKVTNKAYKHNQLLYKNNIVLETWTPPLKTDILIWSQTKIT